MIADWRLGLTIADWIGDWRLANGLSTADWIGDCRSATPDDRLCQSTFDNAFVNHHSANLKSSIINGNLQSALAILQCHD
jgi:hypothetical protein